MTINAAVSSAFQVLSAVNRSRPAAVQSSSATESAAAKFRVEKSVIANATKPPAETPSAANTVSVRRRSPLH